MILETSPLGSHAVLVTVRADQLDANTVPAFRAATAEMGSTQPFVVMDLSHVRFVDSAGLSGLLALQRRLLARKVGLSVCGLTRTVQALFELMQIKRVMDVFESSEAAERHFASLGGAHEQTD